MSRLDGAAVIELLGLAPLEPEGGWFRETHRAATGLAPAALGAPWSAERSLSTAIYYLLDRDSVSALHRLPGEEVFHHYLGDPVEMLVIPPDAAPRTLRLGVDLVAGERPQAVVPAGAWQGSRLVPARGDAPGHGFALLGTTMAPGFDFADFEAASPETVTALVAAHPERAAEIRRLAPGHNAPNA